MSPKRKILAKKSTVAIESASSDSSDHCSEGSAEDANPESESLCIESEETKDETTEEGDEKDEDEAAQDGDDEEVDDTVYEWFDNYDGSGGCDHTVHCCENVSDNDYSDGECFADTDAIHSYWYYQDVLLRVRLGHVKYVNYRLYAECRSPAADIPASPCGYIKRRGLCLAAIGNHMDMATYLMTECESKLFIPQADMHDNPMFIAIHKGSIDFVRLLLKHGWTPQTEMNKLCINSIEQAARCGQLRSYGYCLKGSHRLARKVITLVEP